MLNILIRLFYPSYFLFLSFLLSSLLLLICSSFGLLPPVFLPFPCSSSFGLLLFFWSSSLPTAATAKGWPAAATGDSWSSYLFFFLWSCSFLVFLSGKCGDRQRLVFFFFLFPLVFSSSFLLFFLWSSFPLIVFFFFGLVLRSSNAPYLADRIMGWLTEGYEWYFNHHSD